MTTALVDPALREKRAEHALLEAEVASLKRERDRLARSRPRGFGLGVTVGLAIDVVFFVGLVVYAFVDFCHRFEG